MSDLTVPASPDVPASPHEIRTIPVPVAYYMGAHGDPIAEFDRLLLDLHPDGRVTWRQVDADGDTIAGGSDKHLT